MTTPVLTPPVLFRGLFCCGGIYAHKATCPKHRHTFDGPPQCGPCRDLAEKRRAGVR